MNFRPEETFRKISDISLEYLIREKDIQGLIFDFDGTLKIDRRISKSTMRFIKTAMDCGLKVSVVSNNIHVNKTILKSLKIQKIKRFAFKPLKKPFLDMAHEMKLPPNKIAVIGNNRISDIWGANRAGMMSIYIQDTNSFFFKKKVTDFLKDRGINHVE